MAQVNQPNSKQDYGTPVEFLQAVQRRFGDIQFDAACTRENCVTDFGFFYPEYDALEEAWPVDCTVWCNPPFGLSRYFAEKAKDTYDHGGRVLLLTPASIDSIWFAKYVHGHALVLPLAPRLTFVGERDPINRPLILSCYGRGDPLCVPGFEPWRWKD